jgi:hypothetical protein
LEKPGQRYYAFTIRESTKLIAMKEITDKNFGLIIAFLLPGFLLLWFVALSDNDKSEIGPWLKSFSDPSVSGFLYVILASLALGLIISAVRWAMVDHLLGWCFRLCGKPLPEIDFSKLRDPDKFAAFQGVNENHYRYYQYYSNTLVAIVVGGLIYLIQAKESPSPLVTLIVVALILILFAASADCLFKYHERASKVAR